MNTAQPGILAPPPRLARYLAFSRAPDVDPKPALAKLQELADGNEVVVGLGPSMVSALGANIDGLHELAARGEDPVIPSTPFALWCWLREEDRGGHVHTTRAIQAALGPGFKTEQVTDAFQYGASRDLSGYEDGTENPHGDAAVEAGFVQNKGGGLDGSSFVAVQKWLHNLDRLQAMAQEQRDNAIGRRLSDNEELDDAPESAHVKRTAQESFDPEAFVLRRSMPWADPDGEGLMFVAFGKSLDAFEAQLNRMVGAEDGIVDALFQFTQPTSGAFFWCPPAVAGRLDLSAVGM